MDSETQQGLIRVRFWQNRVLRGATTSGIEFHGLDKAPDTVLLQLRQAVNDALAKRNSKALDGIEHREHEHVT